MSEIAAIGPEAQVAGFAIAGARVYPVTTADEVRAAWHDLPHSVAVVILSPGAAEVIDAGERASSARFTVVLPA